jgi:Ni/Co efflux regulator RcnB
MNSMQRPRRLLSLLLAALVATGPAFAKGDGDDHGKHDKHDRHDRHERKHDDHRHKDKDKHQDHDGPRQGAYFNDHSRDAVYRYYVSHPVRPCPPGLARKHNGCLPPGHVQQWQLGAPLARTVVVAPVPQQIVVSLPPPPAGHKYVQVAGDVLLVAVGSMLVVDGINGLMKR